MIDQEKRIEMYKNRYNICQCIKCKIITPNDIRMLLPAIYSYNVKSNITGKSAVLYVGKTLLLLGRTANHLCSLIDDVTYMGFKNEDLVNEDLIIEVKIEKEFDLSKIKTMKELNKCLREEEGNIAKKLNAKTMKGLRMIDNREEKIKIVQDALKEIYKQ